MHTEFVYTHQVPTLKWAGDQLRWVTEKKKKKNNINYATDDPSQLMIPPMWKKGPVPKDEA